MTKSNRYVIDTNLLVSAVLIEGNTPDIGIRTIEESGGMLVFSMEIFEELEFPDLLECPQRVEKP